MPCRFPRVALFCLAASCASLAWGGDATPEAAPAQRSRLTVIELPPIDAGLPGAGRQRAHHALSFATDAPKPLLRSLGIEATDCTLRFRMPSRITRSRETGGGARLDLQLQAGLGGRF